MAVILQVYQRLLDHFGHRNWWPGDSPFEVVVGAILTQAVAWRNVEQAIAALEGAQLLTTEAMAVVGEDELAALIRPARYPRQKARKLLNFTAHLQEHHAGSLERMLAAGPAELRQELLSLWGIGPETADSIILYAAGYPVFVVDAYTRRILFRLGWLAEDSSYQELQEFFHSRLPRDTDLFNDYHAQLVALGNRICVARAPHCSACPLRREPAICRYGEKV